MKNKAIFLVGNFGVGKSSLVNRKVLSCTGIYLEIAKNLYVLGTKPIGADSLSSYKKAFVMNDVILNKDKNIIITGVYYSQIKDFQILQPYFDIVLIYLDTNYENNKKRIESRGRSINQKTFISKQKAHYNLMHKTRGMRKLYVIDNNRDKETVRAEFDSIIRTETGITL